MTFLNLISRVHAGLLLVLKADLRSIFSQGSSPFCRRLCVLFFFLFSYHPSLCIDSLRLSNNNYHNDNTYW